MMTNIRQFALIAALLASPAYAEDEDKLTGYFGFDREDNACPKLGTCTVSFVVSGAAAKAIYQKMRTKAVAEECTGGVEKRDESGMSCYKEGKDYTCHFGYSFEKKRFTDSLLTC
jgi:hypothetical protein